MLRIHEHGRLYRIAFLILTLGFILLLLGGVSPYGTPALVGVG